MVHTRFVSKKEIDNRYWRNVEIQDAFWRRTFADFVKPLKAIYRDPVSAGAFLLSAYSANPAAAEQLFKKYPHKFGTTMPTISTDLLTKVYEGLLSGKHGPTLIACVQKLEEQRAASEELALFAAERPTLYWELQAERAARHKDRKSICVRLLGQSIHVDQEVKPRTKRHKLKRRKPKVKLAPYTD